MKKVSLVIILLLCLFGGVGAVLASSFATENTKQQEEDASALGMENQQTITNKNTPTEKDGCMEDMKTNMID